MPYRQPSPRFLSTAQYTVVQQIFLNSIKPWGKKHWSEKFGTAADHNQIRAIKADIKNQLVVIQNNYCAFCGLNLKFAYKVHREHIAPQYKQSFYIFEPENLVLACNFCNEHKSTKKTITTDTRVYATEDFKILHPHRDDFNLHLACDFTKQELVFKILGLNRVKTQATIDCVGLAEPHLMAQRGAIILKESLPKNGILGGLVNLIIKINRKRN